MALTSQQVPPHASAGPEIKRSGFDHWIIQFLFFTIVFWIPFYRWRRLSESYSFLKVDWLLCGALLAIIAPYVLVRRRLPRRLRSNLNPILGLFFLVNLAASLLSPYGAEAIAGMQKLLFGYVLIAMALMIVGPRGYQRTFPVIICLAVTICASLAAIGLTFNIDMLTEEVVTATGTGIRAAGGSIGANNSALMYIFCLPFLVHWLHYGRSRLSKLWAAIQIAILLYGLITTYSRGGFLIFVVVVLLLLWAERHRFHPRLLGPVMALACAIIIVSVIAVPESFVVRIKTLAQGSKADVSMSRRTDYLKVGFSSFMEDPLLGSGTDTFKYRWYDSEIARRYEHEPRYAHNTYVEVIVGSGIVGMIFFICLLLRAYANYTLAIRAHMEKGEERLASLATSYRIAFLSICGYLMMLSAIEHKLFLLILASSQLSLRMAYAKKHESSVSPGFYDASEDEWAEAWMPRQIPPSGSDTNTTPAPITSNT